MSDTVTDGKVYIIHNLDGVNRVMVEASTLQDAAKRIKCSVYYMRQMGWQYVHDGRADLARANEGKPLYQPIDARDYTLYPWRLRPYHRSQFGGWQ